MIERPSVLHTSCSGPDGSGKDTAVLGAIELLFNVFGKDLRIVRLDRPPVHIWMDNDNQVRTEKLFLPWFRLINTAHRLGDAKGSVRLVQAANALNVLTQGWVIQPATCERWHPNLFFSGRNYFTDAAVYADFYAPELARMSLAQRLRFMKKVSRLPDYDQIYLFYLDPEVARQRILARISAERVKSTGQIAWPHRHETVEGLSRLSASFACITPAMNSEFPQTQIIPVDASRPKQEVASLIAAQIGAKLQNML